MRFNKGKILKPLTGLLLLLFVGYVASITLFYHDHTINGMRVVHSHPYSEKPDTGHHKHTCAEVEIIANLSVLLLIVVAMLGIEKLNVESKPRLTPLSEQLLLSVEVDSPPLRAPPAL